MELWHGSTMIVRHPDLSFCREGNDYGRAFYMTEHLELAREWACRCEEIDGVANRYELDLDGLTVLDLDAGTRSVLEWLSVLLTHRVVNLGSPVALEAAEWIRENYPVDLSGYDVICGYRADDSYFSFVRQFVSNSLSVEQLSWAMRLGGLGRQVALRTPRALDSLEYVGFEPAPARSFYPRRKRRDLEARKAFSEGPGFDPEGIYVLDLVSGRVGKDDERLR